MTTSTTLTNLEKVINALPAETSLHYVHYDENLNDNPELAVMVTFNKEKHEQARDALLDKTTDWYAYNDDAECEYIIAACKKAGVDGGDLTEDDSDRLRDIIRERDTSDPLKDLLNNTDPIHTQVVLGNPWERFDSERYADYFKSLLEFLRINPRDYAQARTFDYEDIPDWPNINYTQPPLVNFGEFIEEVENHTHYMGEWVFYGSIAPNDVFNLHKEGATFTVPAGGRCGIYDSCHGAGSTLECTTNEAYTITINPTTPTTGYTVDDLTLIADRATHSDVGGYGCSIDSCYGLTDDQWGTEFAITAPEATPNPPKFTLSFKKLEELTFLLEGFADDLQFEPSINEALKQGAVDACVLYDTDAWCYHMGMTPQETADTICDALENAYRGASDNTHSWGAFHHVVSEALTYAAEVDPNATMEQFLKADPIAYITTKYKEKEGRKRMDYIKSVVDSFFKQFN
jgi:hypothetical protein